ncbi:MAG: YybH family protein [Gemmatimonadota bacterium]
MPHRPGPLLPCVVGLLVACTPPGSNDASDAPNDAVDASAGLDSVYAVFTRAYAEADVDLLMDSVYASDGYYLPPGGPILEGQDSFRGQFEAFLGPIAERGEPGPSISFDIRDRAISGDLAYDIGVYTLRPSGAPADAPGNRGKFIVIWKRDAAGDWRIHADGFSAMGD